MTLDQARVKKFLEPWINEMSGKYPSLSEFLVKNIIISAAQKGVSTDTLKTQLSPFFPREKDVKHFVHKYQKVINDFSKQSLTDFTNRPQNRPRSPPKYARNEREHQNYQYRQREPPRISQTPRNSENPPPIEQKPSQQSKSNQIQSITTNSIPNAPSFFLDSSSISLRAADQKIKPLLFNDKGERIDEDGNVIKTEIVHRGLLTKKDTTKDAPRDKRIPTVARPVTREFKFINPGVITKDIEEKRSEYEIDMSVMNGLPIFDVIAMKRNYEAPSIDWWDTPYVQIGEDGLPLKDNDGNWIPNYDGVNNDYENAAPVPVPHPKEKELPTILTPEERKRIRHFNKVQKQNEERLMIKLNLKEKEPERIRASQMINFQGGKAVLAPTEIEMKVKKAREDRQKKHEETNIANKLTPEQKHEKKVEKRKKDSEDNVTLSVYCIKDIPTPLQFAKLTKMANKWFMTGGIFIVSHPELHFVICEAGPKGTRKYESLICNRMKWGPTNNDATRNEDYIANVFQGNVNKRHFYHFKKYLFPGATQCRKFCGKANAEAYFDSAARQVW